MKVPFPSSPAEENHIWKQKLVHDLQAFLWQFEQGGYSRESMRAVLEKFTLVLEKDSENLHKEIKEDIEQMLGDCRLYATGKIDSLEVVKDLDRLRRDLEE